MDSIVEVLKSLPDYCGSNGRTEEVIVEAERTLSVTFSKDYHQYLKAIGLALFNGHELTGLTDIARLNVVVVTEEQRALFEIIPSSWYVIEEANIDGIVIWQDEYGSVYQTAPFSNPVKIAESLVEYVQNSE